MSWQNKSLKDKKVFYKQRQFFFDAVRLSNNGSDNEVVKYNNNEYRLITPNSFNDYVDEKRHGYCVIFSKKYKSNMITIWNYSDRNGFTYFSENNKKSRNKEKVLCFAEIINNINNIL
jgi:hypothetical protein